MRGGQGQITSGDENVEPRHTLTFNVFGSTETSSLGRYGPALDR